PPGDQIVEGDVDRGLGGPVAGHGPAYPAGDAMQVLGPGAVEYGGERPLDTGGAAVDRVAGHRPDLRRLAVPGDAVGVDDLHDQRVGRRGPAQRGDEGGVQRDADAVTAHRLDA